MKIDLSLFFSTGVEKFFPIYLFINIYYYLLYNKV